MREYIIELLEHKLRNDPNTGLRYFYTKVYPVDGPVAEELAQAIVQSNYKASCCIVKEGLIVEAAVPKVVVKERNEFGELIGVKKSKDS